MTFPSRLGGDTTREVGFFDCDHRRFAEWLVAGFGPGASVIDPHWECIDDALKALRPGLALKRHACMDLHGWTLLMTDGPLGTDVGMLPSLAARQLGCRGIRAVRADADEPGYPARILEVYGPQGTPPFALERTIAAANDGGRWVFETSGTPFAFEDQAAYSRKPRSSRFTGEMLHAYLLALGVPADAEPDWRTALVLQE